MANRFSNIIQKAAQRRSLRHWNRLAKAARGMDLATLRAVRASAPRSDTTFT